VTTNCEAPVEAAAHSQPQTASKASSEEAAVGACRAEAGKAASR
jgi:hypothetical protein